MRRFAAALLLLTALPAALRAQEAATKPASAPTAEPKKAPWRVDAAHGPERDIAFETREGTWMSVDVSPDGASLAFDLLGDIYRLPIEGGDAVPLTSGRAYDFQPRWSPDGDAILFTSDRGGTDNIWIMALDGGQPRALSRQKDKVTNSGDWSPDGRQVLVRRRLTDRSSLGTVELWLLDSRGGSGVQVTKKAELGDANGPVFGPSGRYIYFAGRKSRFQYNRNVNEGFWQLKRFECRTGELRTLSAASGGSSRPRVSPDGRFVAIVRRIRDKSCLYLHDLESGAERLLDEGLDPDMQESFAWTGCYPGYDWTPDSAALVLSAGGKLWRLEVATGARSEIPFRVKVERKAAVPLRFKVDVETPTLDLKVLRWMQKSPTGALYFGALDKLYVVEQPGAAPRRLTDSAELEFAPSLSADGSSLVYVTWTDRDGGHIVRCRADGSEVTRLTRAPGSYYRPRFSPDGEEVVFIRGSGGFRRGGSVNSEDWMELSSMPASGGEVTKLKTVGRVFTPCFTPDGGRIFIVEGAGDGHARLSSVDRRGKDLKKHLKVKFLGELMVSPDARTVAYQRGYQVYVTAIPQVWQQEVEAGDTLPHFKLSKDGGDWPNWAGADRVTYSLGATFYEQSLSEALEKTGAKLRAKDQKKAAPEPDSAGEKPSGDGPEGAAKSDPHAVEPSGRTISLRVPRDRPSGLCAYVGARLITMKGAEVIEDGVLLVRDARIVAVGARSEVTIPPEAKRFELEGRTILPGFVDVHAHMHWGFRDVFPEADANYYANLAYGVTTIHDPSAFSHTVFGQGERVAAGVTVGPRVFSTGTILYGADSRWTAKLEKPEDAEAHVRRLKAYGAISVKSYMQPRREQRQWMLAAARKEGLMVYPEGGGNLEMNLGMVIDGHSGIEHTLPVAPLYDDVIKLVARSGVGITPTMLVSYGGLSGQRWFYKHFELWKNPKLARFIPQGWIDRKSRRREISPEEDYHHKRIAVSLRKLVEAGGSVQLGSHGELQGLGAHWELWAIAQGGMKPYDALRCATTLSAAYIGLDHVLGSLEVGKLADFQVLGRNPLELIENTDSLIYVVANGRVYDAATMDQVWPEPKPCPRFFWQRGEGGPGGR